MEVLINEKAMQALKNKLVMLAALSVLAAVGCGNNNPAGSGYSAAGESERTEISGDGNSITQSVLKLDLGISSKAVSVSESRLIESNTGNQFNSIVPVSLSLEPGETADLQQLQPHGIFALYLHADADFTLKTIDGLDLTVKSIMLERCSFIDLKIFNSSQQSIKVSGIIAGE
ncbi:MAG: hypothetical protein K1X85_10650 [Ignavibacteria bacterium]|nr:hypothetical protein [Ignavibacteria bacterium]